MEYESIFVLTLILAFLFVLKFKVKSKHRYPPGPSVGIPYFGIFPSYLGPKPYETLDRWSKEFGEIFSIKMAGRNCIVLNSFSVIREAYVMDGNGNNFLDRPLEYNVLGSPFGFRAFAFLNGPEWALQRKLFTSVIRKGGNKLEGLIFESATKMVSQFEQVGSEAIDVYKILADAALNAVSSLVCGQRLCETDSEAANLIVQDGHLIFSQSPGDDGYLFGNLIKIHADYLSKKGQIMAEVKNRQHQLMKRFVDHHEAEFDPNNIRDYIDVVLKEKYRANTDAKEKWFDIETITANMFMFFVAGVETSTSTLYFGIFLLAKHPSVQERCFEEINSVVGAGKVLNLGDRSKLPYFSAVLNEINRYSVTGPLPQSRQNIKKTQLMGYDIPEKSLIITNLWTATRDPKLWDSPYEFDPNRSYGKNCSREMAMINFSLGKRACPGESLATVELFLFLGSIVKNFKILEVPEAPLVENTLEGFTRALVPYKVRLFKRT